MPDWSYHPLKSVLLKRMKPEKSREFIHKSMSTVASIPGGRSFIEFLGHMKAGESLQRNVNGKVFSSPVGLSGIIDPNLSGLKAFQELGFGFMEVGPIVLDEPSEQKPPIRDNHHILFSDQPEKVPLKLAIRKLNSINSRIPVFARIDAHVTSTELSLIAQQLTPFVDAFICEKEQLTSMKELHVGRPIYVTTSVDDVLDVEPTELDGVILHPAYEWEDGYRREAKNANEDLKNKIAKIKMIHPELTIITNGGVETPEQGYALLQAGADLILLTEGYVKAGPGLPKRIHERILYEQSHPPRHNWHWSFLFGLAIMIGGMIALYFAFTSIILPYDEAFIGLTRADILQVNPLILAFMSHDRMAVAGTMISGSILYIQLARHGIKNGMHWAKIAFHSAAIVGFLGILLFIGYGYFDWLHGLFWLILMPIYYFSFKEGKKVTSFPISNHGTNDKAWRMGLYGQLMFVILGGLILVGGVVISIIGVSNVFVSTDITYICMPPEMLKEISDTLIPVIAHDRAGFGSALISVGLLVLMISLWGFRKGERWIWNTLAIGALPAFIAGIGTHFYIGYTTFIHLLPVYLLVAIYVIGLLLSYPFLHAKK